MSARAFSCRRHRGFTLLEVALIVAIIGMMLLIIIGYFLAPKDQGPLAPVAAFTPIPSSAFTSTPKPATPVPATPGLKAPQVPKPATPGAPEKTIELTPGSSPIFR